MGKREIINHTVDGKPIYSIPVLSQSEMSRAVNHYRETSGKTGALSHSEVNGAISSYYKD